MNLAPAFTVTGGGDLVGVLLVVLIIVIILRVAHVI